jgi:membrane-bound serine protease (ClpP class)
MDLLLAILLYSGGLVLVLAEALMPGMILGILGVAGIVAGIVFGFRYDNALGIGQIVIALVLVPMLIYIGFRRLTLKRSLPTSEGVISFTKDYRWLVGRHGRALTPLRPAGMILLDDKKFDVITEGDMIPKDAEVTVVKVEGNKIVVKLHRLCEEDLS